MRLPSVAYGAHTCTTLVPILTEIWHSPAVPTHTQRLLLTGEPCARVARSVYQHLRISTREPIDIRSGMSGHSAARLDACFTGIYAPYFLIPLLIGTVEYARLSSANKLKAN